MTPPNFDALINGWRKNFGSDHVALVDATVADGACLTYREVKRIVSGLARALSAASSVEKSKIVIMLPNGIDISLFYLACLHGGMTAVPISAELPSKLVTHVFSTVRPDLVVCAADFIGNLPPEFQEDTKSIIVKTQGDLLRIGEETEPCEFKGAIENILSITFTSGTASLPKGVSHTVGGLLGNAFAFNQCVGFDASMTSMHTMPATYMAGLLNTLLCPLAAGATVVLAPAFNVGTAMNLLSLARDHNVVSMWLSPTMISFLTRMTRAKGIEDWIRGHFKYVFSGTAPLPQAVREAFRERFSVPILESYGMTEVLIASVQSEYSDIETVGQLLPGVEGRINAYGELEIRSLYMMSGYIEENGSVFAPLTAGGWFVTGDQGAIDDDGALRITGRSKDIIIKGGANISPKAVEDVIIGCKGVADAAVIGVSHPFWGEEVVAIVELCKGEEMKRVKNLVRETCAKLLPEASVPTQLKFCENLPRTTTGKVQKAKIRENFETYI